MVSYRFFPEHEEKQERFSTRPPKAPLQALRSRLWVLALLEHLDVTELAPLNAQLVLPPADEGFVFGITPQPLRELCKEDLVFEGPLERGTDPAGRYFGKKEDSISSERGKSHQFSLAERVEEHAPGSRRWLLEPVAPYFESALPTVSYALQARQLVLANLGLKQISWAAAEFGMRYARAEIERVAAMQYAHLASLSEPHYLCLLISALHEQCWHDSSSIFTADAAGHVDLAFKALICHPMLTQHPLGDLARLELESARSHVLRAIRRDGSHSVPADGMDRPQTSAPILFCRGFQDFSDANYVASLGWGVPSSHFERATPSQFYSSETGSVPSREESLKALEKLLHHTDLT